MYFEVLNKPLNTLSLVMIILTPHLNDGPKCLHSKSVTIASETLNLPSPKPFGQMAICTHCETRNLITRLKSPSALLSSSFYCDAQRVENGVGLQWPKFYKSSPITCREMLISPSEKFDEVVEAVSGTSSRKENSCCSGVLLFGRGFPPEPKICKCRRSAMKGMFE
ncbi:hypothetical protein CEXT_416471 [Caerostris extrusa]|uniref:Uncharacterized protein n=1 Tax=Caerostris extrusa TaxID=172846 RepID=A0AAV4Y8V8_CAEEX|nr:hypothetical protein CEXT_416471 [Caerostris extrusa]